MKLLDQGLTKQRWTANVMQQCDLISLCLHRVDSAINYSLGRHISLNRGSNFWPREHDVNRGAVLYRLLLSE